MVSEARRSAVPLACVTLPATASLGIPTIATTHSDGSRPPFPNNRDQQCGAGADGTVG
jgi:hypothetical protein